MEHFFVDENYYDNLEDFIHDMSDGADEEWVNALSDTWEQKIEFAQLEKIIKADNNLIDDICEWLIDSNCERFPEESERTEEKIKKALKESINLKKLQKLMPELWYPQFPHQMGVITKKDLLDAI